MPPSRSRPAWREAAKRSKVAGMYPRHRFDGLTDGIFAVAMTLLVLEIRLPDSANPHTSRELLGVLAGLWPKVWPYVLSFVVLGGRWRDLVEGRTSEAP